MPDVELNTLAHMQGGTDVPVADGGTGVSTLPSGLLIGAGTGAITATAIPAGGLAGLTALALKADAANPVFTGTVTIPDGALAIADTSGLQTALDAKATLASPTFTGTVVLPAATVTSAMLRNSTALSLIGRSANSAGVPADIAATAATGAVLRESASTIGFGTVATAGITDAAVTYAKIQNVAALSLLGRSSNTLGVSAEITAGADGDVLRRSGTAIGFGAVPQASITSLTTDLGLKAPLASPTFTGTVVLPATVTVPDATFAIADTSGLQTALDAKLPLAGGTVGGPVVLGTSGAISDTGPISASGPLTKATHGGRTVLTTGNVTIPNASGDVGMGGMIILGGAHTVTFNSTVTAALGTGDVFCYYVQATNILKRTLVPSANQPVMA